jgi:hypothetical protein
MSDAFDEEAGRLSLYLNRGVVIGDPMALGGLSSRVEPDAVPIEGTPFDTQRTTGEKVDCALCGRHRNHFRGFVVTFADGRKAIIGRNCGEAQLFDQGAWAEMAARSERRKMVALYEVRAAPSLAKIDTLLPVLNRCEDEVAPIHELFSLVDDQLPALSRGIRAATKRNGELSREVVKTITVAGRDGNQRQVEDWQVKVFAVLPTLTPFNPGGLGGLVAKIRRALERVRLELEQEGLTLMQQGAAFQKLRTLGRDLRDAQSEAEKARLFLTPAFWENISKWANADQMRRGNYRVNRSVIRHSDSEYHFGEVRLPPSDRYTLASFSKAERMWPKL